MDEPHNKIKGKIWIYISIMQYMVLLYILSKEYFIVVWNYYYKMKNIPGD